MLKEKDYGSPVTPIFEKFSIQKDVSLVYGEPIDVGKKKILPVARVNYLIGGDGDNSEGNESLESGQGEDGGGHISSSL
ncbi:hypothetical protein [Halobacillus amylolyticus]|uniref:Uncharacterized protein n=1 Tax=Halobacillus amylolyticus TaxID=2932259 RepID=A0ABY4H7C9_9BACI|nr:hypothetical protein [Halobacillus amylolyticus]UOR10765.1 hypothetical protein MUO15_14140 [Halobacillus amylolyticus]